MKVNRYDKESVLGEKRTIFEIQIFIIYINNQLMPTQIYYMFVFYCLHFIIHNDTIPVPIHYILIFILTLI